MARRRVARSQIPLEWKTDTIQTTDTTVTRGEFDLDLLPDEIAEIHIIDSTIAAANIPDAANDDLDLRKYISMDPDADDTPLTLGNLEDLEVLFTHTYDIQQEIGAAGSFSTRNSDTKILYLPEKWPMLVGTNFAQVVVGDAITVTWITTVYFKRRAANAMELNQILLKRR